MCKKGDDSKLWYAERHDTGTEAHNRPENCIGMLLRRQHLRVLPTPVGDGGSCEGDGDPSAQLTQRWASVNVIRVELGQLEGDRPWTQL